MLEVNRIFQRVLDERGLSNTELLDLVATEGTLAHLDSIPEDLKRVFVCAHDISPAWHVKMQAGFQRHLRLEYLQDHQLSPRRRRSKTWRRSTASATSCAARASPSIATAAARASRCRSRRKRRKTPRRKSRPPSNRRRSKCGPSRPSRACSSRHAAGNRQQRAHPPDDAVRQHARADHRRSQGRTRAGSLRPARQRRRSGQQRPRGDLPDGEACGSVRAVRSSTSSSNSGASARASRSAPRRARS